MSKRSTNAKKAARVRKALGRRTPPPANIDLVDWLITRRYAQTRGGARKMLEAGKVKSESHVLGRVEMPVLEKGKVENRWVAQPIVSAKYRDTLQVVA